jgi:hypothetical protein
MADGTGEAPRPDPSTRETPAVGAAAWLFRSRASPGRGAVNGLVLVALVVLLVAGVGAAGPLPPSFGGSSTGAPLSASVVDGFGYYEKTYHLLGFNPLAGYLRDSNPTDTQVATLVSDAGQPVGIYYVDNSSRLDVLYLANGTIRPIASVVPLYQTWGYPGMLDDEFFIEYGGHVALFFGTLKSQGTTYSVELVNLTTGRALMWNTTEPVDRTNQQPQYVGNGTVLVFSSNETVVAWDLLTHQSWTAGRTAFFEANNVYWLPQRQELIDVEADGSSADRVEQLNATYDGAGRIHLTSVAEIAVDSRIVFNFVNGLGYNASVGAIAFSAGYYRGHTVFTYVLRFGPEGLLGPAGEIRYAVVNGSSTAPDLFVGQRYVYTSDYVLGGSSPSGQQYLFDPWNGSAILTNRAFLLASASTCDNACFEGTYAPSVSYLLDYHATERLGHPMYRVVYAFHDSSRPFPSPGAPVKLVRFVQAGLPAGIPWTVLLRGAVNRSTGSQIAFAAPPGTYPYQVTTIPGYEPLPTSGTLKVGSRTVNVSIAFQGESVPPTYPVTFSESGLPSGTTWSVSLNSLLLLSTGDIAFPQRNGTYLYQVGEVWGFTAEPAFGSISVHGRASNVAIAFVPWPPVGYSVVFSETGLPSGTNWSVVWAGSATTSLRMELRVSSRNGTYSFSVPDVGEFHPTPSKGWIRVAGLPVTEPISFQRVSSNASVPPPVARPGHPDSAPLLVLGGVVSGVVAFGTALARSRGRSRFRPPARP